MGGLRISTEMRTRASAERELPRSCRSGHHPRGQMQMEWSRRGEERGEEKREVDASERLVDLLGLC